MKLTNILSAFMFIFALAFASALPLDFNATDYRTTNMNTTTDSYLSDTLCGINSIPAENCTQYTYYVINGTFNGALDFNTTDDGFGNWINNQTGEFYYAPNASFNGSDHFYYIISNGTDNTTAKMISIGVDNIAPVYVNSTQKFNTSDGNLTGNLSDNVLDSNGDRLYFEVTQNVHFGQLNLSSDGSFNYTSNKSNGVDYFKYRVTDLHMDSSEVIVIIVLGNNTAPIANADLYSTANVSLVANDVNITGNVLSNDTDAESDVKFAYLNTTTQNGTLVLNSDGSFEYYPNVSFVGIDSFTYFVSDQDLNSSIVTVNLYVNTTVPQPEVSAPTPTEVRHSGGGGRPRSRVNVNNTITNQTNTTGLNLTNTTLNPNKTNTTTNSTKTVEESKGITSLITGAVIGVVGKTGAGAIVLLLLSAIVAWIVISKRKKANAVEDVEPAKTNKPSKKKK